MKKAMGLALAVTAHFLVCSAQNLENKDSALLQPVEIIALRASIKTPVSATTLQATDIAKNNTGRDLPFLLNLTPSVVVNADAGNGIGYTGIRIRGTDATRINVTINNIPYNDAESQGTFFVDVPDLASSASSIQIQRGVGTSTNGTGAFGGSINISTNDIQTKRKLELSQSLGSYHSLKSTLLWNSGLINNHFTLDGRLSRISSDGYIDRAFSKLQSGYLSTAWLSKKYSLRFNIIHGREKTYQAWYGIREDILDTNRTFNPAGTEKPGTPYDNETDNYKQTHYQAFQNVSLGKYCKASLALFLTRGKGYYEQYKADQALQDYGLPDYVNGTDTTSRTDLIRRLWLDNYYYGSLLTMKYNKGRSEIINGAGWTGYDGKNFGEVVRSIIPGAAPSGFHWYSLDARKTEGSAFSKWEYHIRPTWTLYVDGQIRAVHYRINGFRYNPQLIIDNNYLFFNPKIGITFSKGITTAYMSFARAAKEPNRDDFEASKNDQPRAEKLNDLEAGTEIKNKNFKLSGNIYYMNYRDQLVLTGRINDVGAYARTNIPESYRAGIELSGSMIFNQYLTCFGSATVSRNRVRNFTEYVDNYDNGTQQQYTYTETDLSYSPSLIASAGVTIIPMKKLSLSLDGKYVSRQYLDNTSRKERSLHPFLVSNVKIDYEWKITEKINASCFIQGNNLFSEMYAPNGYTFSYIYGGQATTENYYYPMAPFNILAGIKITVE